MKKLIFVIALFVISISCFSQGSGSVTWNAEYPYSCCRGSHMNGPFPVTWVGPFLTSFTLNYTFIKSEKSMLLKTSIINVNFDNKIKYNYDSGGKIEEYAFQLFTRQKSQLYTSFKVVCEVYYNGSLIDIPDYELIRCNGSTVFSFNQATADKFPVAKQARDNSYNGTWEIRKLRGIRETGSNNVYISNCDAINTDFQKFIEARNNSEKEAKNKASEAKKQEQAKITEQSQSNKNQTAEQNNNSSTTSAPKNQSQTDSYQSTTQSNQQDVNLLYQKQQEQENERRRQEQNRETARQVQQSKENYERQLEQSKQIEDARTDAYNAIENAVWGTPEQRRARMKRAAEEEEEEEIEETRESPKSSAMNYDNLAWDARREKKPNEAILLYSKAIELDPINKDYYISRAQTYYRELNDYDNAVKDYSKYIQFDANFEGAFCDRGGCYIGLGKYDLAIEDFNQAIRINPSWYGPYFSRGQLLAQKGKNQEAIMDFSKAIELYPTYADASIYADYYFNRGIAADLLGDMKAAIRDYTKTIELNNRHFEANYNLGVCYFNMGVEQFSVENQITTDESKKVKVEHDKSILIFAKAIPFFETCHELKPQDISTMQALKQLYSRCKMTDKYNSILIKLGEK